MKEFMMQIHETGVFEQILHSIKNPYIMLVLKYHLFLTLKNLVERDCVSSQKYNYLIQNLIDPQVVEKTQISIRYADKSQVNQRNFQQYRKPLEKKKKKIELGCVKFKSLNTFFLQKIQLQQQVVETIWEVLQKEKKEHFQIEITKQLIDVLCGVLKDQTDVDLIKKGLDIFDRVMSMSAQDVNQKKHIKWLQKQDFNSIIHSLQQNKNEEISKKAVAVVSYLDSDEGSDSDSMEDEYQD